MRLLQVRLQNYRGITDRSVSFASTGVTIVEGPNEVGKTSIPEALQLIVDVPDTSRHSRVRSVKPVDRDVGPEVEVLIATGVYEFVYRKRWLRNRETVLTVTSPSPENLTGREAHDRVKAILAETLDEELWRALRIEQGTKLALPSLDLPSMGRELDRAAGGEVASEREDTLWDLIGQEYERYWTRTGRANQQLASLEQQVTHTRDEVERLKEKLDDIDSDTTLLNRLAEEATRIVSSQEEFKVLESELRVKWENAESLSDEVERLTLRSNAAESKRDTLAHQERQRQEMIKTSGTRSKALSDLEMEAELAAPALVEANRNDQQTECDLENARGSLVVAESLQRLAHEDRDYRRQQIELAQLQERNERYEEAAKSLRESESTLESAKVDDDLLGRIEEAYLEDERAKAAAVSAAATVSLTALRRLTVQIDGEHVELEPGEERQSSVSYQNKFIVPDVASLHVKAGPEARDLAERRESTQDALRRLLDEADVVDLPDARRAADRRREALRLHEGATKTIRQDLRDLTPEVLVDKIDGLSKRVTGYPSVRSDASPLPNDFEEAKRAALQAERYVVECQTEYGKFESAAKLAGESLRNAQINHKVLAARINDARQAEGEAADTLAAARADRSDEDLRARLVVAQVEAEDALKALADADSELRAADPESLETRLENARNSAARAFEQLTSNQNHQHELQGRLSVQGDEGLHTLHEEAFSRLTLLERDHRLMKARADAARLLKETFARHRQQARQRYMRPLKERIEQLGRVVFGPTFEVELDEGLRVARRTVDGSTLELDQLSTGALEQLGVLSRLACACIVSPDDGGAPVMIDDALGWSDPQRLQTMGAAIASAGKQCQVIVLTCTPGRYSNVGTADVIALDTQEVLAQQLSS